MANVGTACIVLILILGGETLYFAQLNFNGSNILGP